MHPDFGRYDDTRGQRRGRKPRENSHKKSIENLQVPINRMKAVAHTSDSALYGPQIMTTVVSRIIYMPKVIVDVALKPEILDPQGRAIVGALGRVGLSGVADVRQGKQFVLSIDGDVDDTKLAQINEIAATLLSNPVIEDFTVQVRA